MIPPVNEGTIQLVNSYNPLKNKLVLNVHWFEKDHTDSEHYSEVFDIKENQWEEIIQKDLVGMDVEFDLLDEKKKLVKITFPSLSYSEDEVHKLVLSAWHDGWNNSDSFSRGRQVAHQMPDDFWEENKKKK